MSEWLVVAGRVNLCQDRYTHLQMSSFYPGHHCTDTVEYSVTSWPYFPPLTTHSPAEPGLHLSCCLSDTGRNYDARYYHQTSATMPYCYNMAICWVFWYYTLRFFSLFQLHSFSQIKILFMLLSFKIWLSSSSSYISNFFLIAFFITSPYSEHLAPSSGVKSYSVNESFFYNRKSWLYICNIYEEFV